jgi:hypothetical protein
VFCFDELEYVVRTGPSFKIYSSAKQFYNLAKPALDDHEILRYNVMAVICNLALCVELLLKSADSKVRKYPGIGGAPLGWDEVSSNAWGHDLGKIFDGLDLKIRGRLESSFGDVTGLDLSKSVRDCKDYFIHARYAYEPASEHSYDVTTIQALAEGLIKVIGDWHIEPRQFPV